MTSQMQTPATGGVAGALRSSSFRGADALEIPQTAPITQEFSATVAAALMRAEQRQRDCLLDIKRGSLWTVAAVARDHLDSVLWSLEQPQFDQVFPCAEAFVEHARAVAKLANDFENERRAIAGQTGAAR
jgi:hypothetical protein